MRRPFVLNVLVLFATALLLPAGAAAQTGAGSLTGIVADQSGAAVPGATVTATNQATNVVYTATSNNAGNYTMTSVPVGVYVVKAELSGSKTAATQPTQVEARQTVRLDFKLPLGAIEETVVVVGTLPPPPNPVNDKWSAIRFKRQRDEIIDFIAHNGIEHLVFLTGDMHCCYHATMQIGAGSKYESTTVHELAGGPVNQLQLADPSEFIMRHADTTSQGSEYEIVLDRFHSEVSAVMHLKVTYVDWIAGPQGAKVPEVEWNVIRTLTDTGSSAWKVDNSATQSTQSNEGPKDKPAARAAKPIKVPGEEPITGGAPAKPIKRPPDEAIPVESGGTAIKLLGDEPVRAGEPTMSGRISFVRKRKAGDLPDWPKGDEGNGHERPRRRA
jgi:hypothetical protein